MDQQADPGVELVACIETARFLHVFLAATGRPTDPPERVHVDVATPDGAALRFRTGGGSGIGDDELMQQTFDGLDPTVPYLNVAARTERQGRFLIARVEPLAE